MIYSSWFHTPKPTGNNTIGCCPPKTKFPGTVDGNMVSNDFKNKIPLKFDFFIRDEELKMYLSAPKLTDKNGCIRVNPVVFENSSFSVPKSNICPVVDKFLRDQLTDNLVTDEYIDITDNLVKTASNIPKDNPRIDSKYIVELLLEKTSSHPQISYAFGC